MLAAFDETVASQLTPDPVPLGEVERRVGRVVSDLRAFGPGATLGALKRLLTAGASARHALGWKLSTKAAAARLAAP